jgi:hypothetical protein
MLSEVSGLVHTDGGDWVYRADSDSPLRVVIESDVLTAVWPTHSASANE